MMRAASHANRWMAAIAAALVLAAGHAHGASIPVENPGFEAVVLSNPDSTLDQVPPGWRVHQNAFDEYFNFDYGTANPPIAGLGGTGDAAYLAPVPDGNNVGYLYVVGNGFAVFSQVLDATLQAGTTRLTVSVGNPRSYFDYNLDGFPGARIEIDAGDQRLVYSDVVALEEASFQTVVAEIQVEPNDARIGRELSIWLFNGNSGGGYEVDFDDVRVETTPVPEPASAASTAIAVIALAALRFAVAAPRIAPSHRQSQRTTIAPDTGRAWQGRIRPCARSSSSSAWHCSIATSPQSSVAMQQPQ